MRGASRAIGEMQHSVPRFSARKDRGRPGLRGVFGSGVIRLDCRVGPGKDGDEPVAAAPSFRWRPPGRAQRPLSSPPQAISMITPEVPDLIRDPLAVAGVTESPGSGSAPYVPQRLNEGAQCRNCLPHPQIAVRGLDRRIQMPTPEAGTVPDCAGAHPGNAVGEARRGRLGKCSLPFPGFPQGKTGAVRGSGVFSPQHDAAGFRVCARNFGGVRSVPHRRPRRPQA